MILAYAQLGKYNDTAALWTRNLCFLELKALKGVKLFILTNALLLWIEKDQSRQVPVSCTIYLNLMFLLCPGALVVPWTRCFCLALFLLLKNHWQRSGKICRFWVLNVRHAGQSRLKELNDRMDSSHSDSQLVHLIEEFRLLLHLLIQWSMRAKSTFLTARAC